MSNSITCLIGPQYKEDGQFRKRMRFHQSWYRAAVLTAPFGTGPHEHSAKLLGSMLTTYDGRRGRNFLTKRIHDVALKRIRQGGGVEEYRCLHNLLSSQPMCLNLLAPLVDDLELATRLLQVLLPDELRRVTEVRVEYAPTPRKQYLDDRTAFDAFVGYECWDGSKACIGIETKLTDPFGPKRHNKPRYEALTRTPSSPWRPGCWDELPKKWNQLWRNQMLVEAVCKHTEQPYEHGRQMLVRHPGDEECDKAVTGYRQCLNQPRRSFIDAPLDRLLRRWAPRLTSPDEAAWLDDFRVRYLQLSLSEAAWKDASAPLSA